MPDAPDAATDDVDAAAKLIAAAGGSVTGTIALTQQFVDANASEKLLSVVRPASSHVAEAFAISEGDNVIHLRTLRRVNGVALCLIDHYFTDLQLWPVLQTFTHGSLHDLLRDRLDIELTRVRTKISARRAQAKESKVLEIPNMAPLLCVRTLNSREGESLTAEYSVSLTRADMIEFTMEH